MNNEKSLKLIMNAALEAASPKGKFKKTPTKPKGKLIVLGAGKAAASMAKEFENNYEGPIEGLVITRYGHYTKTKFIEVIEAAHPEPDRNGLLASKKTFDIASNLTKSDHVVFLISGGASSLLTLPLSGISFEDISKIFFDASRPFLSGSGCEASITSTNLVLVKCPYLVITNPSTGPS